VQKQRADLPPTKPSYPERIYAGSSSNQSSTSSSLNELIEITQAYTSTALAPQETDPRPPTPPNKKTGRLSSSTKYRKRLSDLNSPTQLIEACKQRTNLRFVSLGLKEVTIDENSVLETDPNATIKHQQNEHSSSSDQENDRQSSESFEEDQYYMEDEEIEFLDAEEFSNDEADQLVEDQDAWDELKSYLENSLIESQLLAQFGDSTASQTARELVETFNKRSLLNHFNNQAATPVSSQQQNDQKTPYFTPREGRSDTVPNTQDATNQDLFFTPRTTLRAPTLIRRSSTLDRKTQVETGQLKPRLQQSVAQVDSAPKMNGIDQATPHRAQRQRMRRGPRRATVAVDLKRESLAPDDAVANKNLTEQQKAEQQAAPTKIRHSPSVQQRRRALHIRPTDENLARVIQEIEMVKNRHKNEKERHLQVGFLFANI
jgi:hypothetical protein